MHKQTKRCQVSGCRKVISRRWRNLGKKQCAQHDVES